MRIAVAVLLAATATVLGGCGGDEDGQAAANCRAEARNAAQAAVLADAWEDGELGTREDVMSHFTEDDRIFDEQGRMVPYEELEGLTKGRFDSWRASSAIPGEVQHDMAVAREVLHRTDYPGC